MSLVVLDTDVASAILRQRLPDRPRAKLAGKIFFVTFVTLAELTKWTIMRDWGPRRLADLDDWFSNIGVLPFDEEVARTWGILQAGAQRRGRPRPVNDTWIAACCIVEGLSLATFNTKDFVEFAEHDGLALLDLG